MTQPTTVYLGADGSRGDGTPTPKVYLRTLLFATAKRGRVIEGMYVELTRNQSGQIFPVWVLGDDKLVRGSGVFVGNDGLATSHHFLTLKDGTKFEFLAGEYDLAVHAKLLNVRKPVRLFTLKLELSVQHAADLREPHTGVYFDWIPIKSCFVAHSEKKEPGFGPDETAELLRMMKTRFAEK